MRRRVTVLLALLSFGVAFLASALAGIAPAVRLERSLLALGVGAAVGALCGWLLERMILARLAEKLPVEPTEEEAS